MRGTFQKGIDQRQPLPPRPRLYSFSDSGSISPVLTLLLVSAVMQLLNEAYQRSSRYRGTMAKQTS